MIELRRTQASIFEEPSTTIYEFLDAVEKYKQGNEMFLRNILIPGEIISTILPVLQVKKQFIKKLLHGTPLEKIHLEKHSGEIPEKFTLFNNQNFIGVYKKTNEKNILARPEFVLQPI
jgi:tRNA U55 pseudouridine synthase TruB